jgi:hypothetical protein
LIGTGFHAIAARHALVVILLANIGMPIGNFLRGESHRAQQAK